ncbi:MAG: hypothetical protein LBP53_08335 [Candidatus Peribacteria bacterium]|jgi:hypothetical protein|nr:hypothetical protein [Candidatus Peribacteria bacterium]
MSAASPMELIQAVLQNQQIPFGKERLHIAYNVIRSVVQMAKDKNIPLSYQNHHNADITHTLQIADNGNITLATNELEIDIHTGARRQHIETIFDYNQHFAPTTNRNTNGYSLEHNLTDVMNHFTQAMNQKYQSYRRVMTNRRFSSDKFKANLNIHLWKDPMNFLANLGTTRKFAWGPVPVTTATGGNT